MHESSNLLAHKTYLSTPFTFTETYLSTTFTLTWPATVKWPGGTAPTLSTANNAIDVVTLVWDNTAGGDGIYYGQVGNNFS